MPVHVALVDATDTISASDLAEVAGALNQQVQSDFAPTWHVAATVGAYPKAPPHTWRIELRRELDQPGALGYHADENHQPYSLVDVDDGVWTSTASHELLEMLGDPWGNRLHAASALAGWEGSSTRVQYLVELCDPCEKFSYQIGGIEVSDFLLPDFYRSTNRGTHRYSFLGSLTSALEIAEGGYISFVDPADGHLWQRFADNGSFQDKDWGPQSLDGQMLRERCDQLARDHRLPSRTRAA